jgi:hypothetical protein
VIGRWAEACFPVGSQTTESELRELLKEAADSANDYGPKAAIEWANGYTFPQEYVQNDIRCLGEAQGDFQAMARKRLAELTPGRINADRSRAVEIGQPGENSFGRAGGRHEGASTGGIPDERYDAAV